jgi:hypothetical protein
MEHKADIEDSLGERAYEENTKALEGKNGPSQRENNKSYCHNCLTLDRMNTE